jgi:phenylalanyl-tRNA synthetase alpha chain
MYSIQQASPKGMKFNAFHRKFNRFNCVWSADLEVVQSARDRAGNGIFNVPVSIEEKMGRNLHLQKNHPLNTIKTLIETYFQNDFVATQPGLKLKSYDNLSPIVTTKMNFDDLLTPEDHVSRRPTDTYYVDDSTVLRCHTSAHQVDLLRAAEAPVMLCSGDVYRRDEFVL